MVREANKVAGVLPVEDQALLTDELRQLQRVLTSGRTVELHGPRQRGKRLRIESGPLCGVEGIVPQQSSSLRMYVPVTVLKRTVSVSVDACALEAISPRGRAKGNALEPQT